MSLQQQNTLIAALKYKVCAAFYKKLYKFKPNDSPTVKIYLTKIDKHIRVYECG